MVISEAIEDMQKGTGKKIAKAFFEEYAFQEDITKKLYKKAYDIRKRKKQRDNPFRNLHYATEHLKYFPELNQLLRLYL